MLYVSAMSTSFALPAQLQTALSKKKTVRESSYYKPRSKTSAQAAKTLARLPPVPAGNKSVMQKEIAAQYTASNDFTASLERFAMDTQFGLGLPQKDKDELMRVFAIEHRKQVKKMQLGEIETALANSAAFKAK